MTERLIWSDLIQNNKDPLELTTFLKKKKKKDIQMTIRHMKRFSRSLVIKEMHMKVTIETLCTDGVNI